MHHKRVCRVCAISQLVLSIRSGVGPSTISTHHQVAVGARDCLGSEGVSCSVHVCGCQDAVSGQRRIRFCQVGCRGASDDCRVIGAVNNKGHGVWSGRDAVVHAVVHGDRGALASCQFVIRAVGWVD